jgi:hypothetical protein
MQPVVVRASIVASTEEAASHSGRLLDRSGESSGECDLEGCLAQLLAHELGVDPDHLDHVPAQDGEVRLGHWLHDTLTSVIFVEMARRSALVQRGERST